MRTVYKKVSELSLDLQNYRTIPQKNEVDAIIAMMAIKSKKFWALMDSLIDGYIPTENIIVLKDKDGNLIVKEGNRRIAILKLILNIVKSEDINIPSNYLEKITNLPKEWKQDNETVPCLIYEHTEAETVDKIVALTHGKKEKASRDEWTAVATARHNRDVNKASEPALDLLEKFIRRSKDISDSIKEKWAGEYPVTTLHEAIVKLAPRLEFANSVKLVAAYPKDITHINAIDSIIIDIGNQDLVTKTIRATDFASDYSIPPLPSEDTGTDGTGTGGTGTDGTGTDGTGAGGTGTDGTGADGTGADGTGAGGTGAGGTGAGRTGTTAYPLDDPRSVQQLLKNFKVIGEGRSKVASLRAEMQKIVIPKNPIAFCFLLRSAFEISAHAYCNDFSIPTTKTNPKGEVKDLTLAQLLAKVIEDLIKKNTDSKYSKLLIGAKTEITKPDGILSITAMNQLVHNPIYSITVPEICVFFNKIFPLLQEMNNKG